MADGLATAIDEVAARAAPEHAFLRYGWYAAALAAYGGAARTLVVEEDAQPTLALPLVGVGPAALKLAAIPGSYWPFRSFPLALDAGEGTIRAALHMLSGCVNGLRIGPVYDGDVAVTPLIAAARRSGWTVLDRFVAKSWLLDIAALRVEGGWPRGSTLRKNRFHEKHLAAHGALDWRFLNGEDWPAAFEALATIEEASWIAARTDATDAKFTRTGHGAFWRAAAADPVLAAMFRAALLTIDGRPAAFSFDIDAGTLTYAIANSLRPAVREAFAGQAAPLSQSRRSDRSRCHAGRLGRRRQRLQASHRRRGGAGDPRLAVAAARLARARREARRGSLAAQSRVTPACRAGFRGGQVSA